MSKTVLRVTGIIGMLLVAFAAGAFVGIRGAWRLDQQMMDTQEREIAFARSAELVYSLVMIKLDPVLREHAVWNVDDRLRQEMETLSRHNANRSLDGWFRFVQSIRDAPVGTNCHDSTILGDGTLEPARRWPN